MKPDANRNTNTNEEASLTTLSASLDSRIKRLCILMEERKDLVDDYNIHQMGKETIMNAMNRHLMKAMQHRPLLPSSDSTCSWNYWKERYVYVRMHWYTQIRVIMIDFTGTYTYVRLVRIRTSTCVRTR